MGKPKRFFSVLLCCVLLWSFAGCAAVTELVEKQREVETVTEVEKEREVEKQIDATVFDLSGVVSDGLDPAFDYSGSVEAVKAPYGIDPGSEMFFAADGKNFEDEYTLVGLQNLKDKDEETAFVSPAFEEGKAGAILIDLTMPQYLERITLAPMIEDGKAVGFPTEFYIEISNDNADYKVVVYRNNYTAPDRACHFKIGAQSARYIRIVALQTPTNAEGEHYMAFSEVSAFFDLYHNNGAEKAETNATYYVSEKYGDDSYDGKSEKTPFKTLARVNRLQLSAGNRVLLRRGESYKGLTLEPVGDGTAENPIYFGSYGDESAANPKIIVGNGAVYGIRLYNSSYVTIDGIDVDNSVIGIQVESFLKNYSSEDGTFEPVQGIKILNCNVTDALGSVIDQATTTMPYPSASYGAGLNIAAYGHPGTWGKTAAGKSAENPYIAEGDVPSTYYKGIEIDGCTFDNCDVGITTNLVDIADYEEGAIPSYYTNGCKAASGHLEIFSTRSVEDMKITNTSVTKSVRSGGIMLYGVYNGEVTNCLVDETGTTGMWWGVAALQMALCENVVVSDSEFSNTYLRNGSVDGEGVDFESGLVNCTVKDSYIHDNAGPGVMFYGENLGWGAVNVNNRLENCTLENNGSYGMNDHSRAIKDYQNFSNELAGDGNRYLKGNIGGVVTNCTFVQKYYGQGVLAGYEAEGEVYADEVGGNKLYYPLGSDAARAEVYNAEKNTTYLGVRVDMETCTVINPAGLIVAGKGFDNDDTAVSDKGNILSYGKTPVIEGKSSVANNYTSYYRFDDAFLTDNELSGAYPYNSGFSSGVYDQEAIDLSITFDLGEVKEANAVAMFGLHKLPNWGQGTAACMLPRSFEILVSEDGSAWETVKIKAIGENGAPIRGGVEEVVNFTAGDDNARYIFEFMDDVSCRYVKIHITEANWNVQQGKYEVQIAELQVLQSWDLGDVQYVHIPD